TGLEDHPGLRHRRAHRPALGDGQRERLLAINVFARLARLDDRDGVPVVRRADLDGVDVVAAENLAKIDVRLTTGIAARSSPLGVMVLDEPFGGITATDLAVPVAGTLAVDVADGDDLHTLVAQEAADVVEPLVAGA